MAGGCLYLRMTKESPDRRQTFAERQRPAGKRMSKVMNAHILQPGALADAPPRPLAGYLFPVGPDGI